MRAEWNVAEASGKCRCAGHAAYARAVSKRTRQEMGRHGVPDQRPWLQRPREPFVLNGFTLRFVIFPVALAVAAIWGGVAGLMDDGQTAAELLTIGVALSVLTAFVVHYRRPVRR